ncbi:hypothetical protein H5410_057226 [Solanum commersonii]|uniref:Uncharacterized protein n=1 Tax=Solanum commersonii TaxID=4109 RepID=A0A9J5WPI6_SOLCO|nr:hypothetical protein H5410_057226 [Solanum commersonii]
MKMSVVMTMNMNLVEAKRGITREGVESSTSHSAPSPTVSVRAEPTGSGRGRGKPKETPSAPSEGEPPLKRGRGRQKKNIIIAGTTKKGRGRGRGNISPEKRPRVMGMGVFQATNGFKHDMPSSKIYSTGQTKVTRASDVIGDIGKAAILTSKLHELREKKRKKTIGSSSNNPSQTSSQLLVVQFTDEVLHINTRPIQITYIDNSN